MYECVDVYNYKLILEVPSKLNCLEPLPVR